MAQTRAAERRNGPGRAKASRLKGALESQGQRGGGAGSALRRQKAPPLGKRPGVLQDPAPQGRVGQHCLDVPVLEKVEQHVEVLSFLCSSSPAVLELGYRSAHPVSSCMCCSARGSPRTADGGTVGGSADAVLHLRAER